MPSLSMKPNRKKIVNYIRNLQPQACVNGEVLLSPDHRFPVYAINETRVEAENELLCDFLTLWQEFVEVDPTKLTGRGIILKKHLIEEFGDTPC